MVGNQALMMRARRSLWAEAFGCVCAFGLLAPCALTVAQPSPAPADAPATAVAKVFEVKGIVKELRPAEQSIVVTHQAIPNYMPAMTMPFNVASPGEMNNLKVGDRISFRLRVTGSESSIDHISKLPGSDLLVERTSTNASALPAPQTVHSLRDYKFTNELGQAVSFNDFKGQALALTFFFTRCPIPEFCPRLSKNFAEACQKMKAVPNAPTNWHLLSITFDPEFDTPAMLKSYGHLYNYEPAHWSFLTGAKDKIQELARGADVQYQPDGAAINHNFRTLIIDAAGKLQMVFPTSGDLSDAIVTELLKAAAVTNKAP
jgi:protein SCO1/2